MSTTITVAGRVLFDFVAEGFPEVSVSEGDQVDVHYAPQGSPWIYVHTKSGRKGYIPVDYFEEDGTDTTTGLGVSEEEADIPRRMTDVQPKHDRSNHMMDMIDTNPGFSSSTSHSNARSTTTSSYGYMDAQQRTSRDAAKITALAATAAAQATRQQDIRRSGTGARHRSRDVPPSSGSTYHHSQRSNRHAGEIPEQILDQVSGHSLAQCVLVTFHREFVPQISSLLGYFGSQFGVVLNRMKIRYDEVRPYTIAVFAHEDVAESVLEQAEHLVHDKSRVTKPIRIRVFPLYDYARVFS